MREHLGGIMTVAVYAGSFDPLTLGHVDIIRRGRRLFDQVIVAVAPNSAKRPLFSTQDRMDIVTQTFADDPGVTVDTMEGLLVEYARRQGARTILRGLRGVADFEYELQMSNMNRKLADDIETVFLMTGGNHFYVSSRLVKEVAQLGGDLDGIVTDDVARRLREKFA
jgi:pantetheine-phosphate adenylyltransferase